MKLGCARDNYYDVGFSPLQYLAFIIVGVGTFFNVVFHMCIKEPPCEALVEREKNKKKRKKENLKRRKSDNKGNGSSFDNIL